MPYVIRGVDGKARVYVCAFEKEQDAENLQLELGTKTVPSKMGGKMKYIRIEDP